MSAVSLDALTKVYATGVRALDALDLEVNEGEFAVLVGPSGCGKTTALRMVAGLEQITSGTLRFGDQVVNDVSPRQRDVAMVFQNYALYPHLTVAENIGFSLTNKKVPAAERERRVRDAAAILGLTDLLNRTPRQLSGGQRQRVAMGRAIVREPAIFLMDEPLSNLDAKLRVQMRTQVSRIQRRLGTTTVYVTHDQVVALTLGDRVAVMRSGLLQQVGSPAELYHRPYNLFVAGFIGSPAMNFLPGSLEGGALRTSLGDFPLTDELRRELEGANTGRDVIVGIRPEDFEDAALVPAENRGRGITFKTAIDVLESIGSDVFVYFARGRDTQVSSAELDELAADSGSTDTGADAETVTARLDAATKVREGTDAELWADGAAIHVFDPNTGRNLSLAAKTGGPVPPVPQQEGPIT